MNETAEAVSLLAIFVVSLFCSKYGYKFHLLLRTKFKLKRAGYRLEDVKFSFDRMVYTISLPTSQPDIMRADKESFRIVEEFDSWIYPRLKGVRILLRPGLGNAQLISYMPMEEFRQPLLDQLLLEGEITEGAYRRISACKLMLPSTKAEIIDEVYKQIHNKRFS